MYVARFLHASVDAAQKAEELSGPLAWHTFPDDQARLDVQRGDERGCVMALVVVGHRSHPPLLERLPRLRSIKRVDLGLLIDAEHDRAIWRIKIEAVDLSHRRKPQAYLDKNITWKM